MKAKCHVGRFGRSLGSIEGLELSPVEHGLKPGGEPEVLISVKGSKGHKYLEHQI